MTVSEPLIRVESLVKHYGGRRSLMDRLAGRPAISIRALNGVSFTVARGETLGLIGESGCGKSTLGRAVLRLHEPTAGRVTFDGADVTALSPAELKAMRRDMQIIFQDPYASLNPRRTVAEIVGLPLKLHNLAKSGREARDKVAAIMERVGLKAAHLDRYPHQFSGGQRQRIGIARALISNPRFIVCDEPVSALDVSIQAQIIKLLIELKRELGLTYLFVSHDISVIGYLSDRVAVMYLGEIVEMGPVERVLQSPRHPYTQSLLSAVPDVDSPGLRKRVKLTGDLPSPQAPPPGCKFHTRCPLAVERCRTDVPVVRTVGEGHTAACHFAEELVQG
ncbi:peptide/nickel transport system ATP-binding protein/oligopeptide transport system ATP-binding protein [Rhizobium petrolearium]|uniref:ATP-binding cassette domain-containing protein n=1 Tax=Neorhizobium petrolearium TaxID=515361 RepID=A0ABY8M3I5_9HYPH|nr:oligopeptide/dipeptide ABC transporter ATP-binding protein [Neorhizobium petrolearium]MBP1842483.1 peptide/nickel transport system ATP-binding protein/oligopeptide transport system ATP-binding protein [Neorhizobium petrolearium]MCC2608870.1 ATP-binding cassette domain-containing protein [Neorhizobium petrolearium]WGI69118.1 ATP-binding cassette domain-containing protein [Neorhizobium petrolearium]